MNQNQENQKRIEGFVRLLAENWGHIQSLEVGRQKYFFHFSEFRSQNNRPPALGERVQFFIAPPFGRSASQARLPRAICVKPWGADESGGASAYDPAEFLSGKGGAL